MIRGQVYPAIASALLLAGCASDWDRSHDRWYRYQFEAGPYQQWADCIESRSYHYQSSEVVRANDSQLFTYVLADCREHMTGPAWDHIQPEATERLIGDAHQAFFAVGARIRGDIAESISMLRN
jgi:hypothetical protein